MTPSRKAVPAEPANHVAFAADNISRMQTRDIRAHLRDFADELVADDCRYRDRGLRPLVPIVDVQVGPANAGEQDANLHVVDARHGFRNVLKPQAARAVTFDQSFHSTRPSVIGCEGASQSTTPSCIVSCYFLGLWRRAIKSGGPGEPELPRTGVFPN